MYQLYNRKDDNNEKEAENGPSLKKSSWFSSQVLQRAHSGVAAAGRSDRSNGRRSEFSGRPGRRHHQLVEQQEQPHGRRQRAGQLPQDHEAVGSNERCKSEGLSSKEEAFSLPIQQPQV